MNREQHICMHADASQQLRLGEPHTVPGMGTWTTGTHTHNTTITRAVAPPRYHGTTSIIYGSQRPRLTARPALFVCRLSVGSGSHSLRPPAAMTPARGSDRIARWKTAGKRQQLLRHHDDDCSSSNTGTRPAVRERVPHCALVQIQNMRKIAFRFYFVIIIQS